MSTENLVVKLNEMLAKSEKNIGEGGRLSFYLKGFDCSKLEKELAVEIVELADILNSSISQMRETETIIRGMLSKDLSLAKDVSGMEKLVGRICSVVLKEEEKLNRIKTIVLKIPTPGQSQ